MSRESHVLIFTEVAIKQEEDLVEDGDNSSPAAEDIGHRGEEGATPEESMTNSPHNAQDGLSGPNIPSDAGTRQQNGMYYFKKILKAYTRVLILTFSYDLKFGRRFRN